MLHPRIFTALPAAILREKLFRWRSAKISASCHGAPWPEDFFQVNSQRDIKTAGNSRRDEFDFPPINKEKAFDIIDVMTKIGDRYKVSAARVALAWTKDRPGVTSVIIGAKNQDQLLDNIACT